MFNSQDLILTLSLLCLYFFQIQAQSNSSNNEAALIIDYNFKSEFIGKYFLFNKDLDQYANLEEVTFSAFSSSFIKIEENSINKGFNEPVQWFKLNLINPDSVKKNLVLEVQWAFLDSIYFSYKNQEGSWKHFVDGDNINKKNHSKFFGCTNYPAFSLELEPNQSQTIYLKVLTTGIFKFPPKLYSKNNYYNSLIIRNILYGVLYGSLIIFFLISCLMYVLTKRIFLIYFAFYVISFGFFQLSWDGVGYELLWVHSLWFHKRSVIIFISLWMIFNCLFTREFLETRKYLSRFSKALLVLICVIPVLIIIGLVNYNLGYFLGTLSAILAALLMLITGAFAVRKNIVGSKYFTISRVIFFSFGLLTGLSVLGLINSNSLTEKALLYVFILDTIFMFFALARKAELMKIKVLYEKSDLVDRVDSGVLILDHLGYIKWANKAFTDISGYNLTEILNKPSRYLMISANANIATINKTDSLHNQNTPYTIEVQAKPKIGDEKWLQIRTTPLFNNKGQIEKIIEVYTDITDSKSAEIRSKRYLNNLELLKTILHELHNSDNFYDSLESLLKILVLSNETISVVGFETINNENGEFNAVNINKRLEISYNSDHYYKNDIKYLKILKGENYVENDLKAKKEKNRTDNLLISFNVNSYVLIPIMVNNKLFGCLGIGVNSPNSYNSELDNLYTEIGYIISKSILTTIQKEKLSESENNFRLLTENIDQVFWLSNPRKKELLIVSKAYEKIFKKSTQSLINNPSSWSESIHPQDRERVRKSFSKNSNNGGFNEKYRIIDSSNGYKWLSSKTFPIKDKNGELHRLAGITEDITEAKKAQDAIDELNRKLTDSIKYSSRIQKAILPTKEVLNQFFTDHFIIYKPLDIISGDFYWMEKSPKDPNVIIFGVIDCTGHGVAGALLSVIGNHFLTQAVKYLGLTNPVKIIRHLNIGIIETIHKRMDMAKDGMDISLCSFNKKSGELFFAGANGKICLIKNNNLEVIKDRRLQIGITGNKINHCPVSRKIDQGDQIYFCTDGFYDQFGGDKGKKMLFKRYADFILKNANLCMESQQKELESYLDNWMINEEQIDDICLMGLKF